MRLSLLRRSCLTATCRSRVPSAHCGTRVLLSSVAMPSWRLVSLVIVICLCRGVTMEGHSALSPLSISRPRGSAQRGLRGRAAAILWSSTFRSGSHLDRTNLIAASFVAARTVITRCLLSWKKCTKHSCGTFNGLPQSGSLLLLRAGCFRLHSATFQQLRGGCGTADLIQLLMQRHQSCLTRHYEAVGNSDIIVVEAEQLALLLLSAEGPVHGTCSCALTLARHDAS
mmetsp:Transcript_69343/g.166242  ORF Transcript_69343/g.166242 Transcript_69343/m.166242 type:complete len:227 (-) Transcript_69343:12-692(-)